MGVKGLLEAVRESGDWSEEVEAMGLLGAVTKTGDWFEEVGAGVEDPDCGVEERVAYSRALGQDVNGSDCSTTVRKSAFLDRRRLGFRKRKAGGA